MGSHVEKVVVAGVSRNTWSVEGAGVGIAWSANDSVFVEDLSLVAAEIDAGPAHADEEVHAASGRARHSEELLAAVDDFLGGRRRERESDQGQCNICG